MELKDPTTYTNLSQGKIRHIDFRIGVDFSTRALEIEARYQLSEPVHGSLYLDTFKIDLTQARTNGRELER
ncbi:MAG: hypothetical protein EHM33_29045, partial [Chloroflexi bacterium]